MNKNKYVTHQQTTTTELQDPDLRIGIFIQNVQLLKKLELVH